MKPIIKSFLTLFVAALAVLVSAGAVLAQDATARTWLNVRAGPRADAELRDTLYPGEPVSVEECEASGWCRITHSGPDGWVNSSYLEPVTGAGGVPATPDCRFELVLGPGGPRLSIICDGGSGGGAPGGGGGGGGAPPPSGDRACFFDLPDFAGDSFCRTVGTYSTLPAVANDRISSVQLHGNAKVRLCENTNMGPFCRDVTSSENRLGTYLNNKVSSLRVYTGTLPPMKQACFFDGPAYTGEYFCMRPGRINSFPATADDRVTSVAVFAGARATLCVNTNLGGHCRTMGSNVPVLGVLLNDKGSSALVE